MVRTAVFQPANDWVTGLFQPAADRIDTACQPKPGEVRKGREKLQIQGVLAFLLWNGITITSRPSRTGALLLMRRLAGRHTHGAKPGGQNILALRCIHRGNPREEFWKYRRNTRAALSLMKEFCLTPES